MRALLHILIPLAILGLGFWGYQGTLDLKESGFKLNSDKPQKASKARFQRPKIRSRVLALQRSDYQVQVQSQGLIRAHNTTTLTPLVTGRVTSISPQFEDGAYFSKGDVLLELDPSDFQTALESAKAQLARAEAAHAQEEARANQALLNWQDAGFKEQASDLVLRKPQLRESLANVISARSSLEQAKRNLERARVKAPYDGRVRKREVGLGQQVGASTALGEIFSTSFAEVRLPLTTRDLDYYSPPSAHQPAAADSTAHQVLFHSSRHNPPPGTDGTDATPDWSGQILRAEGALDEDSKQLFVIARINDPFGLESEKRPLFIGQPVRAVIPGRTLPGVFAIPRKALSGLNEVLVIRDGTLKRLTLTPLWSNANTVITRDSIEDGDLLCITRLPYAPEGAPVEIVPEPENTSDQTSMTSTE